MRASAPASRDLDRFRTLVEQRLGLIVEDCRLASLDDLLARRARALGEPCSCYLARLANAAEREEWSVLAQELTVPETHFFRNLAQFRALIECALPARMRSRGALHRLRILSVGCASGEEPYSLAMAVRELALDPSWEVSILGIDVNPAVLARAARALYSPWALREIPQALRERWFTPQGTSFSLAPEIRAAVRFEQHNLVEDDAQLWRPQSYDVVFFRNTFMYFSEERARALIARVARALEPGGYLFVGHAETLRGISSDFHLCHTHDTFYYRRKELHESDADAASAEPECWIDAIERSTRQIESLAAREPARSAPACTPDTGAAQLPRLAASPRPDRSQDALLELVREERYTDALARLDEEGERPGDAAWLLLEAVLCTHGGRIERAERACRRLLAIDDLHSGAHFMLARCREARADPGGAAEQDQMAIHLDPSFAMPRLHLGRLSRRAGDRSEARRQLARALRLLEQENTDRLLLFGGGFSRETLMSLCRSELRACHEQP